MDVDQLRVLRAFVRQALDHHPLPWRVDRDWTYEVIDNDDELVIKLATPEDAQTVVDLAKEIAAVRKELEELDE